MSEEMIVLGATGCFCLAFMSFIAYFLETTGIIALVYGVVATFFGMLLLAASR